MSNHEDLSTVISSNVILLPISLFLESVCNWFSSMLISQINLRFIFSPMNTILKDLLILSKHLRAISLLLFFDDAIVNPFEILTIENLSKITI